LINLLAQFFYENGFYSCGKEGWRNGNMPIGSVFGSGPYFNQISNNQRLPQSGATAPGNATSSNELTTGKSEGSEEKKEPTMEDLVKEVIGGFYSVSPPEKPKKITQVSWVFGDYEEY
jgi:hypothetical protein